ncbi:MAG TPA: TIR domain-containing protein [Ktedonobacteraceae bacterium]|jgi:WD40 repeat protein
MINKNQLNPVRFSYTHQVFISYSHVDIQFATQLKGELGRCGYIVWLDTTSIPGGEVWIEKITQGISESFAVISIVSKSANESKWLRREYLYSDEQGKQILPVIIDGSNCPFYIVDRQAIIYNGDFNQSFLAIKETIDCWASSASQAVLSQRPSSGIPTLAPANAHLFPSQGKPSTHVPSQQASLPQDSPFSGNRATSEQNLGWEDTTRNEPFYGRADELTTLNRWLLDHQCHVISILGMGGVGKTSLALALVDQVKASFSHVFWRSLLNAPPFRAVLQDCVQYVSDWQETDLPESINDQIALLLHYLRQHRCLIVLDNMETIMQAGDRAGDYRQGYEVYGKLLEAVGREHHQSCLLLTSREKPKEIAHTEGKTAPVRSYLLKGLKATDGQKILKEKGAHGAKQVRESLISRYVGHPLALKLVSQLIKELFEGDIASFLEGGEAIFTDIRDILDQQFERLSEVERELIYWLAIEREAISLDTLQQDLVGPVSKRDIQEALRSLLRRNLIEAGNKSFLLQNVVMEYVTDRLVENIAQEIGSAKIGLFDRYALIKAQAKEYVRESQIRLILTPVVQRLLTSSGTGSIELHCQRILALLHKEQASLYSLGYAAGNVFNLLLTQECDPRGYDFAHLTIRQAHLRDKQLPEIDFAHAHFLQCVFTDIFGSACTIAFSPDGELLALGTVNGEVKLWNVSEGIPMLTCSGHAGWMCSVIFSPDGHLLASSSYDHTVRLWEVSSGKCLKVLNVLGIALLRDEQSSNLEALAFSPDGMTLAISINDQVWLWDINTANRIRTLQGHTAWVRPIDYSSDGHLLASGSEDCTIRLWEASTGTCLNILQGHTGWVRSVTFSPDGRLLASSSNDHTIRLWETSTGQCLNVLQGHSAWVRSVAFSPDGSMLASSSEDHTIRLWEVSTGQCLNVLQGHTDWIFAVVFSPDGRLLASSDDSKYVKFWEIDSQQCIATLRGYSNRILAAALDPTGQWIASGSEDHQVRIWDASNGQCLKTLEGHTNWIFAVAFSPDGLILASGCNDRTIRLWDMSTGQCLNVLQGHGNWVVTLAFSPDGRLLASGSEDHTIRLWEVSTGQCLNVLQGHIEWVRSVAFSPDGQMLVSCSNDHTIRLWEVSTGQCLSVLRGHTTWVRSVAFSPDGRLLVSGSEDHTIRLWEVSTGQCLKILQRGMMITYPVTFCPDRPILASGSTDQTIQLWDLNEGIPTRTLQGHRGDIASLTFSHDGRLLLSGSDDGTMKLWNVDTETCLLTLRTDRPYERMNITEVTGLAGAQKETLKILGAIEKDFVA